MRKLFQFIKAWIKGEEYEAEFSIPVFLILFVVALILFFIIKAFL
jgi:hypothetical protein